MPLVFTLRSTADFLIQGWHIDSYLGLSIAMLLIILVSMVFEGIQSYRHIHLKKRAERFKRCCPTKQRSVAVRALLERSLLHLLQVTNGYVLMLCAMSYNLWIMLSVLVGGGLGFLFVRPMVLHWLEQRMKNSARYDPKLAELKVQFMNGVNEKEGSNSCNVTKLDETKLESCA